MNDLEMCKAIAKLEGLQSVEYKGLVLVSHGFSCDKPYNPITDLALNCMLRDKYEVQVDYRDRDITVWENDEATTAQSMRFESKGDIPRAVIECILKSQGLYNE